MGPTRVLLLMVGCMEKGLGMRSCGRAPPSQDVGKQASSGVANLAKLQLAKDEYKSF